VPAGSRSTRPMNSNTTRLSAPKARSRARANFTIRRWARSRRTIARAADLPIGIRSGRDSRNAYRDRLPGCRPAVTGVPGPGLTAAAQPAHPGRRTGNTTPGRRGVGRQGRPAGGRPWHRDGAVRVSVDLHRGFHHVADRLAWWELMCRHRDVLLIEGRPVMIPGRIGCAR
jgi:hypothetical protein